MGEDTIHPVQIPGKAIPGEEAPGVGVPGEISPLEGFPLVEAEAFRVRACEVEAEAVAQDAQINT